MLVYLNGEYVDAAAARVSVDDRGFLFGDGIYEVIRVVDGMPFEAARHFDRLDTGATALCLALGAVRAELPAIIARLLETNGQTTGDALAYMQITRGTAPRKHAFPTPEVPPTVYVRTDPYTRPEATREAGVAVVTYPDLRWARCDLKTVNLLPNVLAKQHAIAHGAYEAILVRDGHVTEGAISAFFVVRGGVVHTHPLTTAILPSVTRAVVLELCAGLGVRVMEDVIGVNEMAAADELFLASTTNDVMPIVRLDGRAIASGRPGPVTRRLADAFRDRLAAVAALAAR